MKFWKYFKIGRRVLNAMMESSFGNGCDKCLFLHENQKRLLYNYDMTDIFLIYGPLGKWLEICKKEIG